MDSGKSVAGKQSKPSHFDAAPFLVAAASVFITPEPGMSQKGYPRFGRGYQHKNVVLSLIDRDTKQVRSFHVEGVRSDDLAPIIRKNIAKEAALLTDEARYYKSIGAEFKSHDAVNHGKDEYVRIEGEFVISTNRAEGYFSIFKRGMKGIYQHCSERHLHRYLAEFDFRYSNRVKAGCDDTERASRALKGVKGKRLTYQTIGQEMN
jgi:transposase-like protein